MCNVEWYIRKHYLLLSHPHPTVALHIIIVLTFTLNLHISLQVVHYQDGQKYDAHHDWGFPAYNSRCMTLLLYLTDQADPTAGGETSFPKGDDGRGNAFKVRPKKGSAVLFYNLLADGNGDDLALHAAMPVAHGEKYVANFWVWDPKRIG